MRVTIKDVAAEAGVSFQAVSAILGHRSYARASEKTRRKVEETARRLHYVPNISARILQGASSRMAGVLIDPQASATTFRVLSALEKRAGERGIRLLISEAHDNPERLNESCRELQQYGVDGILALAHSYPGIGSLLDTLEPESKIIPVLDAAPGNYSAVVIDTAAGIALAVRHLLEQGYRKPALVMAAPARHQSMKERIRGFNSILPQGIIVTLPEANSEEIPSESVMAAAAELQAAGADAAVCSNDHLAALLSRTLRRKGIKIPEEFGITGYNNIKFCSALDVELTSIEPDFDQVAVSALDLLEQKISGSKEYAYIAIPPRLVVRESTIKNMKYEINCKGEK